MKTLVVYYTRTGNTEKAAMQAARALKADIVRIEDVHARSGIMGFLRSGYEVICNRLPEIGNTKIPHDLSVYDLVVLCTPIWAGHAATPIRTFIVKYCEKFKRTAYVITHMDSKRYENVFDEMDRYTGVVRTASVSLQSKAGNFERAIDQFVSEVKPFE